MNTSSQAHGIRLWRSTGVPLVTYPNHPNGNASVPNSTMTIRGKEKSTTKKRKRVESESEDSPQQQAIYRDAKMLRETPYKYQSAIIDLTGDDDEVKVSKAPVWSMVGC